MNARPNDGGGGGAAGRSSRGRGREGSNIANNSATSGRGQGKADKQAKADKKKIKRAKQVAAMENKAASEDAYFKKCQREAQKSNQTTTVAGSVGSEQELFGTQGVQGINFKNYDDIQVEVKHSLEQYDVMKSFADISMMSVELQRNIERMRYQHPTPIQKHSIPLAVAAQDLMCCAQTGSGKTCAFLLPVIISTTSTTTANKSSNNNNMGAGPATPVCIILAPTRELALQIELEAQKLTFRMPSMSTVCVYGGAKARPQLSQLAHASSSGTLMVVATPGRLTDFVDRSIVSLASVKYLILDEADRMLDMGFEPQIRKLVQRLGMPVATKRQTLLFSATFPPAIQKLAGEFLRPDYAWIAVGRVGSTTNSITQVIVKCTNNKRHKFKCTVEALQSGPDGRTLVFVKKKKVATWLKKQLCKGGLDNSKPDERFTPIQAQDIHGDRSQSQRESALADFRSGKCNVLVATDVAARGLDISGVEHVINMDLPNTKDEFDSYVHRIGRTGRAGHVGLATSLYVSGDDPKSENGRIASLLVAQLKESGQQVPPWLELEVPGGGGGNKATPSKRKNPFGGSDVRRSKAKGSSTKTAPTPGRSRRRTEQ